MRNVVGFDCYEVDLASGQLYRDGIRIPLREKSLTLLIALLERPGELVSRDALCRRLWHEGVFVDFPNNLNTVLGRLREALNDSSEKPRYIETVPKRGYRFIAPLRRDTFGSGSSTTRKARLLVLPFKNLGGNANEEYFSDAITDEVIGALAMLFREEVGVIARTTSMQYKETRKDVGQIGRELDVDYVLEGGVRHSETGITLNVQLIEVKDQTHLFADKYELEQRDVFSAPIRIADAIALHLPAICEGCRSRSTKSPQAKNNPTQDLLAYNLYLQGRYRMYRDVITAKQFFEQALARDPSFALAYDGLAEYSYWAAFAGLVPPKEAFSAGLWAALRALEIDNTLAETHALLGQFRKTLDYDWSEVQREMALAMRLNPTSLLVRFRNALSGFMPHGRLEEALAELERVVDLDPLSLEAHRWIGLMHWWNRDYSAAMKQAQLILSIDPSYPTAHILLGVVQCAESNFDEAIPALRRGVQLSGGAPVWSGWLGLGLAQGGEILEARSLLHSLQELTAKRYIPASCFAWIQLGLGDLDQAFAWMNRAVEDRDPMMTPIRSYPFFDPIRSDPRFTALLRKMNLD